MLRPVPQQPLRRIVDQKLTGERDGVALHLLAHGGPAQPVGAAHDPVVQDRRRRSPRIARVPQPLLRARLGLPGEAGQVLPALSDAAPFLRLRAVILEPDPEKPRHLERMHNLLLQRGGATGERRASGRVEGMDAADRRWKQVLMPLAVKRRRLAVDREAARELFRRCRQRLAGTAVQRRVLRHRPCLGHCRLGPIPPGPPVLPVRDRFHGRRGAEELRSLLRQRVEGRLRVPRRPLRKFPLFFCPVPLFFLPLPLRNLDRGPGQVRRHLPRRGLARERRDARRQFFKGSVSLAPFPRLPFRQQRRSRPVEHQRTAELVERLSELRPRARDTVEMNPVALLVRQQRRALLQRLLRPPRPGGVTAKGRYRSPGRCRFRQHPLALPRHFQHIGRPARHHGPVFGERPVLFQDFGKRAGSASFAASAPMRAISPSQPSRWKGRTWASSARRTCACHSASTGHRAGFSATAMSGASHAA